MFEKNLNDFVRGLRNNKNNENKFITECLDEIKQELRQENIAVKANAVLKLSYIQMLGYDITWAAFNIIEVMSSQKFTHKRIAYMTASQSFHSDLDVLMLATNLIKKDMNSPNQYDSASAMVGLSVFVSPDLARDLANDIMSMVVSSKPYIRKRAVLLMYKIFLNFPEALRPAFPRLKERLEDDDPGVQCATVNVICELARKHPKNYLALAPLFFKLMTTSTNNWMLIKIIKLFGALCPLEPRLGKKLLDPLTTLIHSTSAMSLLYECINTVVAGLPDHAPSMQLCVSKLRLLIEDQDQNLKYLGLLLLNKILKSQPKFVLGHRDLILQCLDDRDESIRYRALDLIVGMISKKTLVEITKKLLLHMEKAEGSSYRDELLAKIVEICSQSNYQFVTNFEWYIDTLVQLTTVEGTKHGKLIANQMLDVIVRVKAIRPYAVPLFTSLLDRPSLYVGTKIKNTSNEVLFTAAWVAGEFIDHIEDIEAVAKCLVKPCVTSLPSHIQSVFIQSVAKMFSRVLTESEAQEDEGKRLVILSDMLIASLSVFTQSSDLEVQDRSCCVMQLIKLVMKMKKEGLKCAKDVRTLFAEELLPVAPKSQKKVPVPEGLDLDKWINEPLSESDESDNDDSKPFFGAEDKISSPVPERYVEPDSEEIEKAKEIRKMFQESNPHYLKGEVKKKKEQHLSVDSIPVEPLDAPVSLIVSEPNHIKGKKRAKKGKKNRKASENEEDHTYPKYEIAASVDLDEEKDIPEVEETDPLSLLNIDLDAPLKDHETLPVATHRVVVDKPITATEKKKNLKKSDRNGKKKKKVEETEKKPTAKKEKRRKKKPSKEEDQESEEQRKATLLAQASTYAKEAKREDNEMDFWLSPTEDTNKLEAEDSNAKVESSLTDRQQVINGEKKDIKKQKEKKKSKRGGSVNKVIEEVPADIPSQPPPPEVDMMQLDESVMPDPWQHYSILCEDKNMKLLYEICSDPTQNNQVFASVIFKNLLQVHIKKLEFNIIDSLNMRLVRQIGAASHEPISVPFQLLPGMTNEGQFAFTVNSIVMSQWLRGTLTYIVNADYGSTSEKIDFKIHFPVSTFIHSRPMHSQEFTSMLASGELTEKQSVKLTVSNDVTLENISKQLCVLMHFTVVEMVGNGASFCGFTSHSHPICVLVKMTTDSTLLIDAKSTDFQLLSSVTKQIKEIFFAA